MVMKDGDELEYDKCKDSPYYFATKYLVVNGKPFTTRYTEDEFNKIINMKDPIVQKVIEKFKERSEAGIKKYGTTLMRDDLSIDQWLTHLQEELMDAVNYIEALKNNLNNE